MDLLNFERAWSRCFRQDAGIHGVPTIKLFIERLYDQILLRPSNMRQLTDALEQLLAFLMSPQGRTDANCRIIDHFLSHCDDLDWDHLPTDYGDILSDMAGALHDTITDPDIALNFESTPEQLSTRLRRAASRMPGG